MRYSSTLNKNMIYVASKIQGDYIIRSSKVIASVRIIKERNMKYYITIIILAILVTLVISSNYPMCLLSQLKTWKMLQEG